MKTFRQKLFSMSLSVLAVAAAGFILIAWPQWAIYLWIPACAWAAWRFSLRYLLPGSFLCKHCGRLKCAKHRAPTSLGSEPFCTVCERDRTLTMATLERMERSLDAFRERIALERGTFESVPHPIVYRPEKEE